MKKGYVLIGVLVISLLLSLGAITSMSVLRKETEVTKDTVTAKKALKIAESGMELALTKYKKTKSCGWTLNGNVSDGNYTVTATDTGGNCEIVSVGKYKDAVRTIKVVAITGSSLAPFTINGNLSIKNFSHASWSPKWQADMGLDGSLSVNGKTGTAAMSILENAGFNFVSNGDLPSFSDVPFTPPPSTVTSVEVNPPPSCDVECKDTAVVTINNDGTATLKNCNLSTVNLSTNPVICSSKALEVKGTIGSSWKWPSNVNLTFYAKEKIVIADGLTVDNQIQYDTLNLNFISSGKIEVDNGVNLKPVTVKNGDLSISLVGGEDVIINGGVNAQGISIENGGMKLEIDSEKSVKINGSIDIRDFAEIPESPTISINAENDIIVNGGMTISRLKSDDDINLSLKANDDINVMGTAFVGNLDADSDATLEMVAGKTLNVHQVDYTSLQADGDLNIILQSSENLSAKHITFQSFDTDGDINIKTVSGKAVNLKELNLESFGGEGDVNVEILGGETVKVDKGINISNMNLNGNGTNVVIYSEKSIETKGKHDLISVNYGDLGEGESNFLVLARELINVGGDIIDYSGNDAYNVLVWSTKGIKSKKGGFDFQNWSGDLNMALFVDGDISIANFSYEGNGVPSGLTLDEMKDLCDSTTGFIKSVYCSIVSSFSSLTTADIKILRWIED
ncbi:MAG: hypothetical protein ABGX27_05460 [Desulfurobacteriaceae bacterium]